MVTRKPKLNQLSRRERQIMDVVYRRGSATVQEVLDVMPEPPSYSAVRALIKVLEDKGQLRHRRDGPRYVYSPTVSRTRAASSALGHLVETFFSGSASETVASLLELEGVSLSSGELDALSEMIERAREREAQT